MAVDAVDEGRPPGLAGARVRFGPGQEVLHLVFAAHVHRRLGVNEALAQRQRGGAGVQLRGQVQHLLQLGHLEVGVVQLQLFHEHGQHGRQAVQPQPRRDGVQVPGPRCHRR